MADVPLVDYARLADALSQVHLVIADEVFGSASGLFRAVCDFYLHRVAVLGWGDHQTENLNVLEPQRKAGRLSWNCERSSISFWLPTEIQSSTIPQYSLSDNVFR